MADRDMPAHLMSRMAIIALCGTPLACGIMEINSTSGIKTCPTCPFLKCAINSVEVLGVMPLPRRPGLQQK